MNLLNILGNMFWDGPGNTKTVVGRRPAAQLVDEDEAGWRSGLQDTRRLKHLRHKRRDSLRTAREYLGKEHLVSI